ncbi:unnamed protein product [Blepharisma stoltei]|uniref:Uncharacterized protein n=1 Tax=Blepharisma stoltei TaxID=1481888 RepID=A0AAU9ICU1_9CILI|nr:unnamed protein product [Blepharisma stoltei]
MLTLFSVILRKNSIALAIQVSHKSILGRNCTLPHTVYQPGRALLKRDAFNLEESGPKTASFGIDSLA